MQPHSENTSSKALVPLLCERTVMAKGKDRGSSSRRGGFTKQADGTESRQLEEGPIERLFRGVMVDISNADEESSSSDDDDGVPYNPTTQRRTRSNMFGITNTEFTRINIIEPVLYVALYDISDAPSEVDDYHWAFIVGPSHEEAASTGTLYNMEPRLIGMYLLRQYKKVWQWLYNQPTVPLRGQDKLLARLMIAEVSDMDMLQAVVLRWASSFDMYNNLGWMSLKWVKTILENLYEEEGCLGRRMGNLESVEAEGRLLAEVEQKKRRTTDEGEQGANVELESTCESTTSLAKLHKPDIAKGSNVSIIQDDEEEGGGKEDEEEEDDDDEVENEGDDENESRSEDEDESGSEDEGKSEDEDEAESDDESGAGEEGGGEDSDGDDDNDENEGTDDEGKGAAEENVGAEKANTKPDRARTTPMHVVVPNRPEQTARKKDTAKEDHADEDDSESEEDESSDEDDDDEDDEEGGGDEDEGHGDQAGLRATGGSISTLNLLE